MKKFVLKTILLIIGLNVLIIQAQDLNNIPKTFPVAPNAYEFNKYGEIPVSKYTGVPNISIPIYTIDAGEGDLKIPITLTYHSNGFRVNEEAGWTGLGWTLNEGGTITQIVNGYDDFKTTHANRQLPDLDAIYHHASNGNAPQDAFTSTKCSGNQFVILEDCFFPIPETPAANDCTTGSSYSGGAYFPTSAPQQFNLSGGNIQPLFGVGGVYDFEPDVFNFSFLGYSGKFVLDWETETFKCLSDPKIKVTKLTDSHNKISITTPEGHIFIFSIKDESVDCYNNSNCYDNNSGNGNANFIGVMSRVYKLDDIYTNKGRHISYSYTQTGAIRNFPIKTDQKQDDPAGSGTTHANKEIWGIQTHSYVNKISFNDGLLSVDFDMSDRLDFIGTKKLDAIKINKLGSSVATKTIDQFNFNYSYFVGSSPISPDLSHKTVSEYTHRLKLEAVTKTGKPSHVFNYNNTQLPSKTSTSVDYWNYYNGFNNANKYPNLHRFNYDLDGLDISFLANLNLSNNNRSSRVEYTKASVLEKITYPTGGYTMFDFELNTFTNEIVPNFQDNANTLYTANRTSYGAGLRVKEIKSFSTNNNLITKKTYSYSGGKLMTPIRFFNKSYLVEVSAWPGSGSAPRWRRKISVSNFVTPSINAIGNFVGYDEVIEHFDSNKEDLETIGSIKYLYENHSNKGNSISTNTNLISNTSWQYTGLYSELGLPLYFDDKPNNGSLLEQWVLDKNNNEKKKVINTYSYERNPYCTFGIRIGPYLKKGDYTANSRSPSFLFGFERSNLLGTYFIGGLYTFLDSTEEINYLNGEEISTKKEFVYNDYLQPIEQTSHTSAGELVHSTTVYTSSSAQYENNNFLTSILNNTVFKDGKLISNLTNTYTSEDVPDDFPNSTIPANHPWPLGYGEFHFKTKVKDNLKDKEVSIANTSNGAPLSITPSNDKTTYYVWGYNKTKIIAKIDNYVLDEGTIPTDSPNHPQVNIILNAQNSSDYDNYDGTSSSEIALTDKLNILRGAFPNAMVTTYTYDPLIGVTSMTDPNGYTVYYEYDGFNRLEFVKDASGNLLSENKYRYKNQQ